MGGRHAARGRDRGGEGIQALRKARTRVGLGAIAAVAYGGVFAHVVLRDATAAPATGGIGGLGLLVLVYGVVRAHEEAIAPALACLGLAYTIALLAHGSVIDQSAPLVACGLLVAGELAAWSVAERVGIAAERRVVISRAVGVGGLALAGLAVATLVVGLSATRVGAGLAWTILGAAAAVSAVGLAAMLARRL